MNFLNRIISFIFTKFLSSHIHIIIFFLTESKLINNRKKKVQKKTLKKMFIVQSVVHISIKKMAKELEKYLLKRAMYQRSFNVIVVMIVSISGP